MKKFLSIVVKDYLELFRDWPGLTVLFLMPAILLIVITLTQERIILSKNSEIKLILVNADSSVLGDAIINDISNSGYFNFVKYSSAKEAESEILHGEYQLAVIIPDSSTERLFSYLNNPVSINKFINQNQAGIIFIYNPALQSMFKDAVLMPLTMVVQVSAMKVLISQYTERADASIKKQFLNLTSHLGNIDLGSSMPDLQYKNQLEKKIKSELKKRVDEMPAIALPAKPQFSSEIVKISQVPARVAKSKLKTNPMQNNIPAFTLFAMFFIVIPLAGSIINEKNQGTFNRIRTLPVSWLEIIFAKILVYISVCILQFVFLIFIGIYVMPVLGSTTTLGDSVNYFVLLVALLASGLAATGFGILVGTFATTHSQASTFGSVMVVILAMLGGIFMPAQLMPELIKKISLVSPLRWGTDAFLEVFSGNGGIERIWLELFLLIGFFCISLILAVRIINIRK